jgi:hypothetical protein
MQIPILETFFIFCFFTYVFVILEYIVHILVSLNRLLVFKWIEKNREKLHIERTHQRLLNLEDRLENASGGSR